MPDGWVSTWWQAMCLPERWRVAGVRVPALSVWHTFALENIGNRYLCGGACDETDAASLLLFASYGFRAGRELMLRHNRRNRLMLRMAGRLRRVDPVELHTACVDYVETCTRAASRWQRQGGKPLAVPYQLHIVRRLCAEYGQTLDGAWDMEYAQARCYFDAGAEADGDDTLMTAPAQHMEDTWQPSS